MNTNIKSKREIINLSLFFLGKLVSLFGTSIYTFAMGLYILKETGSGLSFATNLVIGLLPIVLISPFAGVLADRFNRKKIVVLMDLLSGIMLIGFYFVSISKGLNIMMIYITTFVLTVLSVIFSISLEAGKTNIVSEEKLLAINSISKIVESMSAISGPMIGGLIYGLVDIKSFILINGISFVLSGFSEVFIDFSFNPQEKNYDDNRRVIKDITEGFKYMKTKDEIVVLILFFMAVNFFISLSVTVPLPYIINNILELSSKDFGIIQGAFSIGMILGAITIKFVSDRFTYNRLIILMGFGISIFMIVLAIPLMLLKKDMSNMFYLVYYFIFAINFGIIIALIDIPILQILQENVDDLYRGRVMSLVMGIVKTIAPVGIIISGILINKLQPWILPFIGGILMLLFNLRISKSFKKVMKVKI